MRLQRSPEPPPLARINVTPIIDVALVLVIILLVTAPMMSTSDLPVELPGAHARDLERPDFISVTVARDGRLAVDETAAAGIGDVPALVRGRLAAGRDRNRLVVVRADAALPHAVVRRLLEAAREGGARNLGLATAQIADGRP
ncbi:biopolymer transporter ExbD [bacterium]|nr:biopolymer transporter ExbD [bacterium]